MFTRPFPPTNKGTTSGLNPIANLDALLTTNTYPAKFLLHEITDRSETLLFQGFGIFSNSFGYPFQKEMSVRLNDSFNKIVIIRTAWAIRWKKPSSVPKARAIRLKKLSSDRTPRDIRSKRLSAALLFRLRRACQKM